MHKAHPHKRMCTGLCGDFAFEDLVHVSRVQEDLELMKDSLMPSYELALARRDRRVGVTHATLFAFTRANGCRLNCLDFTAERT